MKLSIHNGLFCVCRLAPGDLPEWIDKKSFWTVTMRQDELSIVCSEKNVPHDVKSERGWRIIELAGPLDFGLTGILASVAVPLAKEKISIFAISTYDTDFVLVKDHDLKAATTALTSAGFVIENNHV